MATTTYRPGQQHAIVRTANRIGRGLDRIHVEVPWTNLDEARVCRAARRSTGLTDFGADDFLPPLRALLEAAQAERPRLTWSGRMAVRNFVFSALRNRLWRQQALTDHPEILEQPVRRPLIVVGAPRTGTTLMYNLLALDPAARPLLMWESFFPAPWKSQRTVKHDPRIAFSAFIVWFMKHVLPDFASMHDHAHDRPEECHWLFAPSFVWPPAMVFPRFHEWLKQQPESTYDRAYAAYRQGLQMLHWQRPVTGHWVLKSVLHIWALPSLMRMVPEAAIIHTHRDMREVLPSCCSVGAVLVSACAKDLDPGQVGPFALEVMREALARDMRARQTVDPARICDVTYKPFIKDPVGTVRRIYDQLHYELTPEYESRLVRYAAESATAPRPKHVYSLEQFGLAPAAIAEAFADYHRQYGIETG